MYKIIFRREFQKSIRSMLVHKNVIWILLSGGELLTLEYFQNRIRERKHGVFNYQNLFVTENYFIFTKNKEIVIYRPTVKGEKTTIVLNCMPKKITGMKGKIYALCKTSIIRIDPTNGAEKLFDIKEEYQDLVLFPNCSGQDLFILVGLWGITTVSESGEIFFFRTFGDLILTPQPCKINRKAGILVGSRNGWFHHIGCDGDTTTEFNTEAGVTAFKAVESNETGKIYYASTNGEIKEILLTPKKDEKTLTQMNNTVYKLDAITHNETINIIAATAKELIIIETKNQK